MSGLFTPPKKYYTLFFIKASNRTFVQFWNSIRCSNTRGANYNLHLWFSYRCSPAFRCWLTISLWFWYSFSMFAGSCRFAETHWVAHYKALATNRLVPGLHNENEYVSGWGLSRFRLTTLLVGTSGSFWAEISVRSPRKLVNFIT